VPSSADPPVTAPARPEAPRDIDATAFTPILEALLERVSGATAAALVDALGETVDYAGAGDPFDVRVAAAHLQLLVQGVARFGALGEPRWLILRGSKRSFAVSALPDGYALALVLHPRAAFTFSHRAWSVCMRALAVEAGWDATASGERSWFAVDVVTDQRGRPVRVSDAPVEVLGTMVGLSVRERGFRVRTTEGSELMVVREGENRWYADEAS